MDKNILKENNISEFNNFYDLGNYYMKIAYNYNNEIIISYFNMELLDGIKYETNININNIKKVNKIFEIYNNIRDIYNIIKKIIEEGKFEFYNKNDSEIILNIIGIAEFKLLKHKIEINNEYLYIINKEFKNIKIQFNKEIIILKDENKSIKNELYELKNLIINLQNDNNIKNDKIKSNLNEDSYNKTSENNINENSIKNIDNENDKIITINQFNKKFLTDIKDNNITELDLGYRSLSEEIQNLGDIEFIQLKKLDLAGNNISDISVFSKLNYNQLQILYLDNNMISDIDIFEKVNFPLIEEIDLSNNKIIDISVLSKVKFDKLKELYLCDNNISNIDALENVRFKDLEKLNLSKNKITDITVFSKVNFTQMKLLYLKNNNIDNKIYGSLINFLKNKIIEFNI